MALKAYYLVICLQTLGIYVVKRSQRLPLTVSENSLSGAPIPLNLSITKTIKIVLCKFFANFRDPKINIRAPNIDKLGIRSKKLFHLSFFISVSSLFYQASI